MTGPASKEKPGRSGSATTFRIPAADDLRREVRDLDLSSVQLLELQLCIGHVAEDLKALRAQLDARLPRAELVRRLKRFAKIVDDLRYEIERWRATMKDFLPSELLEAIGEVLSYSAIEAALEQEIPTPRNRPDLRAMVAELAAAGAEVRMADVEARFGYQRKALGLKFGPELLAYLVGRINKPLQDWLELDRLNEGGRPSSMVRDHLLTRLAKAAPDILGVKATATAKGKFVRLCAAVFRACGLDDKGLEKAVERIVKMLA